MRRRTRAFAVLALSLAAPVASIAGQPCHHGHHSCSFWRNLAWPQPFTQWDRQEVCQPLAVGMQAGWKMQNTLSDYHFDADTGALTEAGRSKIDAILIESPYAFRGVFVLNSRNPILSAARMESVHTYLAEIPSCGGVPVFETCDVPFTTPAQYVDRVSRDFIDTTPAPRIPQASGATGEGMTN